MKTPNDRAEDRLPRAMMALRLHLLNALPEERFKEVLAMLARHRDVADELTFSTHRSHPVEPLQEAGIPGFSLMQTESDDGGRTWTTARPLGFHGSPPHLLRHSSGVLVLTYGCRQEPFGQRVAFSHDDGAPRDHDWIVRDDGPDGELGYPSTVELGDGSLFTVCYQKAAAGEKCSLLWSRWQMPM